MKKILILFLVLGAIFFVSKFGLIKEMFIVNWLHDKKIYTNTVIKKVDNYLIKKYSLKKNDFSLVSVEDMLCKHCEISLPQFIDGICPEEYEQTWYCGKNFTYDIKGKTTKVKYKQYTYLREYEDNFIFDDYQKDQLSTDINDEFKSKIGNKVFLVKTSFRPLVSYVKSFVAGEKSQIRNRTEDGLYVNYYNGDIENFIAREYLYSIDVAIKIKPSELDTITESYLNKFETFSKNYCTKINPKRDYIQDPLFNLYFFDDIKTSAEINEVINNFYEKNNKRNVLKAYYYQCRDSRIYSR